MEIVGYSEKYREGVISCLMRNFDSLRDRPGEQVERWLEPCLTYSWGGEADAGKLPYGHGMVLLDGDSVVGYMGILYSRIRGCGGTYLFANPTTWAIDKKYSLQVFQAMDRMVEGADIIGDFTPTGEMRDICMKMYGFVPVDRSIVKFLPFPCLVGKAGKRLVTDTGDIADPASREIFRNHREYGVRCLEVRSGDSIFYVFYKRIRARVKKIRSVPFARILGVSDKSLFRQHLHETVWFIQKRELCLVESEFRFLGEEPRGCLYVLSENKKLIYSKAGEDVPVSLLYSELAVMEQI